MLTAGQVIATASSLAEIDDLLIDEPAIEDVVRKVYSGELELEPAEDGVGAGVGA